MALREIVYWPDPVLKRQTEPIRDEEFGPELDALLEDMVETMYDADGLGLAAPQVGLSKQLFVVDVPLGPFQDEAGDEIDEFNKTKETKDRPEGAQDAGIADEHVDAPKPLVERGPESVQGIELAQILRPQGSRGTAGLADGIVDFLEAALGACQQQDMGAFARQAFGDGRTDAA